MTCSGGRPAVLVILGFAGGLGVTSVTLAGDATTKACKAKKAGDMVKVDGEDVKCPDKKKQEALQLVKKKSARWALFFLQLPKLMSVALQGDN